MMMVRSMQLARQGGVAMRSTCRQVHGSRKARKGAVDVVNADVGKLGTSMFHYLNYGLLAALPVLLVAPTPVRTPVELLLAVAFPLHAHVSMNYVISDYVPRFAQQPARIAMLGVTAVASLGLIKLSLTGPGLVSTVGALWKKPAKEEAKEEAK